MCSLNTLEIQWTPLEKLIVSIVTFLMILDIYVAQLDVFSSFY